MSHAVRVASGEAAIGIMGLGYVGLAEAVEFGRAGFPVTGFDVDQSRVEVVRACRSYITDVSDQDLRGVVDGQRLRATTDFSRLGEMDAILVCVPTPLGKTKAPDVSCIVIETLNERGRSLNGSTILVLGVAYKRDVHDTRESPTLEIIHALDKRGAGVQYHDPYVPSLRVGERTLVSVDLDDAVLGAADCVLVLTNHTIVDYKRVVEAASVVIDTRNAIAGLVLHRGKVVRL